MSKYFTQGPSGVVDEKTASNWLEMYLSDWAVAIYAEAGYTPNEWLTEEIEDYVEELVKNETLPKVITPDYTTSLVQLIRDSIFSKVGLPSFPVGWHKECEEWASGVSQEIGDCVDGWTRVC
tara:strand:+ start:1482 stop:1847 length:366 start_codon:yes stop_codon:yes gene_type:complete